MIYFEDIDTEVQNAGVVAGDGGPTNSPGAMPRMGSVVMKHVKHGHQKYQPLMPDKTQSKQPLASPGVVKLK